MTFEQEIKEAKTSKELKDIIAHLVYIMDKYDIDRSKANLYESYIKTCEKKLNEMEGD